MLHTDRTHPIEEKKKVKVKVCGLTRAVDIAHAIAFGVAYVGINLWEKSPRYVPPASLRTLLTNIPAGQRVYVDVQPDSEKLDSAIAAGFDYFQIHFDPNQPDARALVDGWGQQIGLQRLWLAPRIIPGSTWPQWLIPCAGTFLCDGHRHGEFGGTGCIANWIQFCALRQAHPGKHWILAGGLTPDNIAAAAACLPDVLDLNSGIENSPGIKDSQKLAQALQNIL